MKNLSICEQKQILGGLWGVRVFKGDSKVAIILEAWEDINDARKSAAYWQSLTDENGNHLYKATVSFLPSHRSNY